MFIIYCMLYLPMKLSMLLFLNKICYIFYNNKNAACPLIFPVCPLLKALKGQIVSWGPRAGSNPELCNFYNNKTQRSSTNHLSISIMTSYHLFWERITGNHMWRKGQEVLNKCFPFIFWDVESFVAQGTDNDLERKHSLIKKVVLLQSSNYKSDYNITVPFTI